MGFTLLGLNFELHWRRFGIEQGVVFDVHFKVIIVTALFQLASKINRLVESYGSFAKLETQCRRGRRVLSQTLPLRSPRLCVSKFPSINTPVHGAIALPVRGLRHLLRA